MAAFVNIPLYFVYGRFLYGENATNCILNSLINKISTHFQCKGWFSSFWCQVVMKFLILSSTQVFFVYLRFLMPSFRCIKQIIETSPKQIMEILSLILHTLSSIFNNLQSYSFLLTLNKIYLQLIDLFKYFLFVDSWQRFISNVHV